MSSCAARTKKRVSLIPKNDDWHLFFFHFVKHVMNKGFYQISFTASRRAVQQYAFWRREVVFFVSVWVLVRIFHSSSYLIYFPLHASYILPPNFRNALYVKIPSFVRW